MDLLGRAALENIVDSYTESKSITNYNALWTQDPQSIARLSDSRRWITVTLNVLLACKISKE